ncbi:integrase [Paenarthrobacter ureafaciens]|nr:integrase [Paenarthrobacter ureafaciens]GLU65823.1 integrase [Paenarthrobacter ureafaciens]GLU70100.1 integrase [Paenarthrobacter ureafaciens]GLU74382.1 integrase [Paenarthrobacter ureafaciens]GLU78587.1 integrase [Paenarthrobacter ureafaciens]
MDWTDSRQEFHSPHVLPGAVLPKIGCVTKTTDGALPWRVTGLTADAKEIDDFLLTLATNDCSPQTLRSYAYDLLRWWRFLAAVGIRWDTATREDVRDLVLWMRQPRQEGRRAYSPTSINHMLSVLFVFYEHHARLGQGPVANPVPSAAMGMRRYEHHNPLASYQPQKRAPYRQRVVTGTPRALSHDLVDRVFTALTSVRDKALVAMYLATGARASELLGMKARDVDWGNQSIAVVSKGTRAYQWVPTSPDSLTWLRLYLGEMPLNSPEDALWRTLRRPYRPLQYSALRAMLVRVNKALGTGITLHDFRHTCASRLANDPSIPLTDVQAVLRHKHLTTTSKYIHTNTPDMVQRVLQHHEAPPNSTPTSDWGYDPSDMAELFGTLP